MDATAESGERGVEEGAGGESTPPGLQEVGMESKRTILILFPIKELREDNRDATYKHENQVVGLLRVELKFDESICDLFILCMVSAGPKSEAEPSVCIQEGIKGFCWVSVTEHTPPPPPPRMASCFKNVCMINCSPLRYTRRSERSAQLP